MKLEHCNITFVKWGSQIHANGFNTLQDAQPYFVWHVELKKLRIENALHL
jgi:hypothetical protein